jgi:plasmid stabilization system protein ParE
VAHPVQILAAARDDFREIKKWVKKQHGDAVWQEVNLRFKAMLHNMGEYPLAGKITEEALALGLNDVRQRLVGPTRIIYQFDGTTVYVHMFVSTRQNFMTHLSNRLLRPSTS